MSEGTKVYGILAAEVPDSVNELIKIEGIDTSHLKGFIDEHRDGNPAAFHRIGVITFHKKIYSEKDCEDGMQKRCWDAVKAPILYVAGSIMDNTEHPNAKAMGEFLKFCNSMPNCPITPGLSIDGGIVQRQTPKGEPTEDKEAGSVIAKSLGLEGAITIKPCNKVCSLFLQNDLTKSAWSGPVPKLFQEALKKSQSRASILESTEAQLMIRVEKLKKAAYTYLDGISSVKCDNCGANTKFFKFSNQMPNRCDKCGDAYTVDKLWKALNKKG